VSYSPEHADCNRSFYARAELRGLPAGIPPLDPGSARYAPSSVVVDGEEHRWWLADVDAEAHEHPATFFVPPLERRRRLVEGDNVRLIFRFSPRRREDPSAERMWVAVAGGGADEYVGYLTNEPFAIASLAAGDVIGFAPRHVASIEVVRDELGYDAEARAFVSIRIADGRSWPAYVLRVPDGERLPTKRDDDGLELVDSGWQVLGGDETEEELADVAGAVLWPLGWLTERFPALLPLIREDVAGEWLWNGTGYDRLP
jgi:hypothetical protein